MIKGLTGTCGVTVSGGSTALPYITSNVNNPIQGMIRLNNAELEVFNGTGWQLLPYGYATVTLDQDILDILQWARKKHDEELEFELLAKTNPTINDLVNQIKEKQHQAKMIATLIKKEETV